MLKRLFRWLLFPAVLLLVVLMGALHAVNLSSVFEWGKPRAEGKPTPRPEGMGWVDLLDAEHAPLWKNLDDDKKVFEIEDGVLHILGESLHPLHYATYTGEEFADFDLHLEFKLTTPRISPLAALMVNPQIMCNSGVFLRAPVGDSPLRGFEIQVLGDYGWPATKNGTGAIYDVVSPMFNLARPTGEWNSYDISLRRSAVTVTVNGWKVIDTDFAQMTQPIGKFKTPYAEMPKAGRIALQDHGGELWYRNILIRPAEGPAATVKRAITNLVN